MATTHVQEVHTVKNRSAFRYSQAHLRLLILEQVGFVRDDHVRAGVQQKLLGNFPDIAVLGRHYSEDGVGHDKNPADLMPPLHQPNALVQFPAAQMLQPRSLEKS